MRLLFQGDSITDWGRNRENIHDLGNGYPKYTAQLLRKKFPHIDWEFINLGVSGDRTRELLVRWQKECIDIQPDILSILIGINDTWRAFDSNDPMTAEEYELNYRRLLEDVKKNTKARIIMMEPFLLHNEPSKDTWRSDIDPKIDTVRRLAREFADVYLPLDGLFAAASVEHEPGYWANDGVHPAEPGMNLIAQAYAQAVGKILK